MTEAENSGVLEGVAAPEAEDMGNAHAKTEQVETIQQPEESDADRNFRRLRESNEQLQQRDKEKDQMIWALQQELLKNRETPAKAPEPEPDPFAGVDPSDWTTFEQTQKVAERIAEQKARKLIEAYEAKRRQEEAPTRLRTEYSDFDAVVTTENVEQLRKLKPKIAQALSLIGDEEAKAVAAYEYIKAFLPSAMEHEATKQRIAENADRPKSLSSTGGKSPLSQASAFEQGLTPDLQKQLWAEMQACAKRA